MGGKDSAPAAPDYAPIEAAAQDQLASTQAVVAQDATDSAAQEQESQQQFDLDQGYVTNQEQQAQQNYALDQSDAAAQEQESQQQYDLEGQYATAQEQESQQQYDLESQYATAQEADSAGQLTLSQQQQQDAEAQAQAQNAQAQQEYGLQASALTWAQQQAQADQAQIQPVINSDLAVQNSALSAANQDQSQYENTYVPLENAQAAYAQNYDTPAREAQNAGAASAAVATQYNSARIAAAQNLEQYGIDPSSTRYAALDLGLRTNQAAAQAAAGNTSILNTQATGQQLQEQAINTGMGVMGGANTAYGTGVSAGNSAANATLSNTAADANILGTSTQYAGLGTSAAESGISATNAGTSAVGVGNTAIGAGNGALGATNSSISSGNGALGATNSSIGAGNGALGALDSSVNSGNGALGTTSSTINAGNGALGDENGALSSGTSDISAWGNATNQGYNNELAAFNANQAASSGLGSLFGTMAGLGQNSIGGAAIMSLATGGAVAPAMAVPAPSAIPTRGGAVPVTASPSRGKAIDDVPARLTAGEFVIPRDVMQWKGEEQLQKLIQKAREDRVKNSPAQGRPTAVPVMPAAFTSRPAPTALPVR